LFLTRFLSERWERKRIRQSTKPVHEHALYDNLSSLYFSQTSSPPKARDSKCQVNQSPHRPGQSKGKSHPFLPPPSMKLCASRVLARPRSCASRVATARKPNPTVRISTAQHPENFISGGGPPKLDFNSHPPTDNPGSGEEGRQLTRRRETRIGCQRAAPKI
jgi:hypothetical protein